MNTSANRPFLLTLTDNGVVKLDFSGSSNDQAVNFNPATAHEVVLYLNDHDSDTLDITGPDSVPRTLGGNTAAFFVDAVFAGDGPFDNTLTYLDTLQSWPVRVQHVTTDGYTIS
jgi:hypothetical protein